MLSSAVMAMSKSPLISPVSWKVELGVLTVFTSKPCCANRPCSCPTQIGQLKPPGKIITLSSCLTSGAGAMELVEQANKLLASAKPTIG